MHHLPDFVSISKIKFHTLNIFLALNRIKEADNQEVNGYMQNLNLQMQRYDEREKEKEKQLALIKEMEKVTRAKQVKDNKHRRRTEDKQQKQLDSYLM